MTTLAPQDIKGQAAFGERVMQVVGAEPRGTSIETVQVSIGLTCNMACRHCHVESSPARTEEMDWPTMALVLDAARRAEAKTLDITGGAPEMNAHFRRFVRAGRALGLHVTVRTNLTILLAEGYEDLPRFFRDQGVRLLASLPCYLQQNVDKQRGKRAYSGSVAALRQLNAVGYGLRPELPLDLVFNPLGPVLPPPQPDLEVAYRRELDERFGIRFTRLIAMTNLPIGRFLHNLQRTGKEEQYRQLLRDTFNAKTVGGLMCRHQLHVGHDGKMYDCDFNYALGTTVTPAAGRHIRDFDPATYVRRRIVTGEHCYGCTAGSGSSCAGALA